MNNLSPRKPARKSSVLVESLEPRRLLAAFGVPWPEPRDLTISFPADGVQVGTETNTIGAMLDQIAIRQEWQELALRAFQTWAIHADINVGLRNDSNLAFGVPGFLQNDPRFGDFRIGAIPQTGLLANSIPFQAIAGSYSGDILINSNQSFRYHDWDSDLPPDPTTLGPTDRDLFSLLLNETGNALGLDDNLLEWSVMFRQYTTPKGVLSVEDVADIQALYGARTDPYELVSNGQLVTAALVPMPVGIDIEAETIRTRGSIQNEADVDVYRIVPLPGKDSVSIRLLSSGISLLKSRLEILNASGQVLAEADAASVFDNDVELNIQGLIGLPEIFVRVVAIDSIYSAGDYVLEVDYRSPTVQATSLVPMEFHGGPGTLGVNFPLITSETGINDTRANASMLTSSSIGSGTRFEWTSSIASATDVDYWKITAPAEVSDRLVIHVAGIGLEQPSLRMHVRDANGERVGARGILRDDGTWSLEVSQPVANQDYYIRISVDTSSNVSVGNYVAVAEFSTPMSQMNHLATGAVDSTIDRFVEWNAGKTRLYRFDLNASAASSEHSVALTIYDAYTLEPRFAFVSRSGTTRTAMVWLPEGDYILRFAAVSSSNLPVPMVTYTLTCDGLSDDQDEDSQDPGDYSDYDPYYYEPIDTIVPEDPDYEYSYTYDDDEYYYVFY